MEIPVDKQKRKSIILVMVAINIIVFCMFLIPNTSGSKNIDMVRIFEPDEGEPISIVYSMISGGSTIKQALLKFLLYDYYHYGFPYFGYSAFLVLVAKLFGQQYNTQVIFPLLRQFVSVLPMLLAITGLTYFWTEFKRWLPTMLLYFSLLTIPAIVGNMMWWHPDGIQLLFIILVMVFLKLDHWEYGKSFFLAAFFCGIAVGIKLQGLFFFMTIPLYLLVGVLQKDIKWKQLFLNGFIFVLVMVFGLWVSNPMLIYGGIRETYWQTLQKQSQNSQLGYAILYPKGMQIFLVLIKDYYGGVVFYGLALLGSISGLFTKKRRLENLILLAWIIPQSIYLVSSVALKYQYLLGAFISLVVCYMNWFEPLVFSNRSIANNQKKRDLFSKGIYWSALIVLVVFAGLNIYTDKSLVGNIISREIESEAIQFYEGIPDFIFNEISSDEKIYMDYRVYFPQENNWQRFWSYEILDYDYINQTNPGYMVLSIQRMHDYTLPRNVENAIDPEQMARSSTFYQNALDNEIDGYELVYEQSFAKIFKKTEGNE